MEVSNFGYIELCIYRKYRNIELWIDRSSQVKWRYVGTIVLDIVSKISINRKIEVSIFPIERVLSLHFLASPNFSHVFIPTRNEYNRFIEYRNRAFRLHLFVTASVSHWTCLLYTSPSPRDGLLPRMPSSA